jgi:hypothetical protein
MGYDASVYLVFGIRIPSDTGRYIDEALQAFIPDFDVNHLDYYYDEMTVGLNIPNTPYSIQSYINDGQDYTVFLQLKSIRFDVLRTSSESPMRVEYPSPDDVADFIDYFEKSGYLRYLRLNGHPAIFGTYLVLDASG